MDSSEKSRINGWIEANIYGMFQRCMKEKRYPTEQEAALIAPLIQMHQAKQLDGISDQLDYIWKAFIEGSVGVWLSESSKDLEVHVTNMPDMGEGKKPKN